MPNGNYSNTLDEVISSPTSEIAWMKDNKLNPMGFDYSTLYISNSKVNDAKFPATVYSSYLSKIKLGVAYSSTSEVDNAIAYNKRQSDFRKKLDHFSAEIEWWQSTSSPAAAKVIIGDAYKKAVTNGVKNYIYAGWGMDSDMCDFIVNNSHGIFLHCYRTTAQANTKDDLFKYCKSRLEPLAAAAKKAKKIFPVTIIFSAETTFMYDFFKAHSGRYIDAYTIFMTSYNTLASSDCKQWLNMDGAKIFVSKFQHLIK